MASLATTIDVAGLSLRVEADDASDLELVTRITGTAAARAPAEAVISVGSVQPDLPARRPDFTGPYGEHWDNGTTHHFLHRWGLGAVVTGDRAVLGGPVSGDRRWGPIRNSMLFVLARLLIERGRFLLHGAAFDRGHGALLTVGPSGAGKSSLAVAAHLAGWAVLGDDMIVVDDGDVISVRGITRVPTVPGDVAGAAALEGEAIPLDPRQRLELRWLAPAAGRSALGGLVVCDHDDGPGRFEPLTAAEALGDLVPALVLSALPGPVARWFPVAARIARGPSVRLRHSNDPADATDRAGELLAAIEAWRDGERPCQ